MSDDAGEGTDDAVEETGGTASTDDEGALDLEGLPVEEAVERVAAAGEDPEEARATLEHVTEDGVVTRAAVDDAVAHVAKVVATPETRLELAERAMDDAREAADGADYDVVAARLAEFEERLETAREWVEEAAERNRELVARDFETAGLYRLAREIEVVTRAANEGTRAADELAADLEEFEEWVTDPAVRADRLASDLEALAETLAELEESADGIERAVAGDGEASLPGGGRADPGLAWFDASVRQRMVALLVADLHHETATLREWAADEGVDAGLADATDRLEDVTARSERLADRLEDLARSKWVDRYGQPLSELEARFDRLEPPVDWADVQATLEQYRTVVE